MADPQLEDGHTQIANEILEHLMKIHLAANQWQVLLCIIRKTYGFHKKVDYIANSQIVEATGLCKAVVSRCLSSLNDIGLIDRKGKYIGFQKDWEQWKLAIQSTNQEVAGQSTLDTKLAIQSTGEKLAISSSKVSNSAKQLAIQSTKVSSPAVAQKIKDTITKDTIQKKEYGEFKNVLLSDEEYQKLIERFGEAGVNERIETLSNGIASKGYKYQSHYATILSWDKRDKKEVGRGTHRGNPRSLTQRDKYTEPDL